MSKVTVLTATTGREDLHKCIYSVLCQSYRPIEHIIVVDGPEAQKSLQGAYNYFSDGKDYVQFPWGLAIQDEEYSLHFVNMPKSIGKDRWNGHRIYAAGSYMADGDYVSFLDDDNHFEPNHIESLVRVIEKQFRTWAYSFRKLHDAEGNSLGRDDCESLGQWPSVCGPTDYFVDVNCFLIPTKIAVQMTPVWYRKFREPNQMEIDRALTAWLRQYHPNYDSNYQYTVDYKVAGGPLSVQPEFFKQGNEAMLRRYNGKLPWVK